MPFLEGMLIGLAIAAPIGPVGILCIGKALADGRLAGFVAGLGAAVADTVFGAAAAFGIDALLPHAEGWETALKLGGGLFMLVLGLRTWRADTSIETVPAVGPGLWRDFVATFAVTITNPATIFGMLGVFAAAGPVVHAGESWMLAAGIGAGSTLWWLILSSAAGAVRSQITPKHLRRLNRASGALLFAFGAAALASVVFSPA